MDFPTYLDQAWTDHATQPQQVVDGFATGASLISAPEQIAQMAALITHVMGEHLAQWETGEIHLNSLRINPFFSAGSEAERAILRSVASLKVAAGNDSGLDGFSISDRIRILAVAASALNDKNIERARELFSQALTLAENGLDKSDPAVRSLAVTGNNLASALQERTTRTPAESKMMITAAHAGRKFWSMAGSWKEVSSAEYRLALAYISAGQPDVAFEHAKKGLDLATRNCAEGLDLYYSLEAVALAERARGDFAGFKLAAEKCHMLRDFMNADDLAYTATSATKLNLN